MGKKYLDTKKGSLESSVLGVWKTAIEEGDARETAVMDGRTKAYKTHRAKLEASRQRRESKKVTKEEVEFMAITPDLIEETFFALGEQVNPDGLVEWTPMQEALIEQILDMTDDQYDDLLEEMSYDQLIVFEGIMKSIGKGLGKVARGIGKRMTSSGRADVAHKKAQKKADTVTKKIATKALKKDTKQRKKEAGIGIAGKLHKGKELIKKGIEKGKQAAADVKAGAADKSDDKPTAAADKPETKPTAAADKPETKPTAAADKDDDKPTAAADKDDDKEKKKKMGQAMAAMSKKKESFDPRKLPDMREALLQVRSEKPVDLSEKHNGHDTHVDPKDRDELDKEADGEGGAETAKKMKKAKEPAPNQMAEASGDKEAYKKFFDKALKKFKIDSPADLKSDEDKKKFYDYIDKGWTADHESAEHAMSQVREFKIQSMKAALAQVWGMEEGKNPFAEHKGTTPHKHPHDEDTEKKTKTETGKKPAVIDLKPEIDDR